LYLFWEYVYFFITLRVSLLTAGATLATIGLVFLILFLFLILVRVVFLAFTKPDTGVVLELELSMVAHEGAPVDAGYIVSFEPARIISSRYQLILYVLTRKEGGGRTILGMQVEDVDENVRTAARGIFADPYWSHETIALAGVKPFYNSMVIFGHVLNVGG